MGKHIICSIPKPFVLSNFLKSDIIISTCTTFNINVTFLQIIILWGFSFCLSICNCFSRQYHPVREMQLCLEALIIGVTFTPHTGWYWHERRWQKDRQKESSQNIKMSWYWCGLMLSRASEMGPPLKYRLLTSVLKVARYTCYRSSIYFKKVTITTW